VAIFAHHRLSRDADHVLLDLRGRFDPVLAYESSEWHDWNRGKEICAIIAVDLFNRL
jgi:hypothetical protein